MVVAASALRADEVSVERAWNDPAIGIRWPIESPTLSTKDLSAPRLAELLERLS